jgi:hypothetical protein
MLAVRLRKLSYEGERKMLKGSCACGRIAYEIHGSLFGPINYCHCWRCRKHSGSSFGTSASVHASQFAVVLGKELLSYWVSSPGIRRYFASCCGSPIYKTEDNQPGEVRLRLGTLDSDPGITIDLHYMVSSKAPWVCIEDSLAQEICGPPFGTRD